MKKAPLNCHNFKLSNNNNFHELTTDPHADEGLKDVAVYVAFFS